MTALYIDNQSDTSFCCNSVIAIMLCYVAMLGLLIYIGNVLQYGKYYYLGLGVATGLAIGQYDQIKKRLKTDCFKAFLHNNWIGLAIFIGLAADYYFSN